MDPNGDVSEIRRYEVWDRTTRIFHWVNVVCVLVLGVLGTLLLNEEALGIKTPGAVLIKSLHGYAGYVFVLNLAWRLVWAFVGNRYARWNAMLPLGKGFARSLRGQLQELRRGRSRGYIGHSPLARMMIGVLMLLLVVQAGTGLLLIGTDLYLPPFGAYFADWVTSGDPTRLALLAPGSKEHVVIEAWDAMKAFRKPFKLTHEYGFYVLLAAIVLHILANVIEDVRHRNGQISSMFSGVKTLAGRPADGTRDQGH